MHRGPWRNGIPAFLPSYRLSCLEWSIHVMLLIGLLSLEELFISDIGMWASRLLSDGFSFSTCCGLVVMSPWNERIWM